MSVHKSDAFISDVEGQYEWYAIHADGDIAERHLQAIEATCGLLDHHPLIGAAHRFFTSSPGSLAVHGRVPALSKTRHFL
jgi:hypothetical protein